MIKKTLNQPIKKSKTLNQIRIKLIKFKTLIKINKIHIFNKIQNFKSKNKIKLKENK